MTESANAIPILAAGEHVPPPVGHFKRLVKLPYFNLALLVGCGIFASTFSQM